MRLVITTPDAIHGVEESALLMTTPWSTSIPGVGGDTRRHQTEIVTHDL
jgi:hypothetical protein